MFLRGHFDPNIPITVKTVKKSYRIIHKEIAVKNVLKAFLITLCLAVLAAFSASADEVTYRKHVKPIMDSHCIGCHGEKNPEHDGFIEEKEKWMASHQGMRMDTYSHLITYVAWPYTGAFMRRLDDGKASGTGKPGNMYEYLGNTETERQKNLNTMKQWVGHWNLKRWKDVTKEDLATLKAKY
jgi:hypothetical protein